LPAVRATELAILIGSGAGAGAMNALAGGGTLLTFPALLLLGLPAKVANATSTVALVPGAAASFAGYWEEARSHPKWLSTLFWPSLIGGGAGSLLLLATPERIFFRLAPILVLFATGLFALQTRSAQRRSDAGLDPPEPAAGRPRALAMLAQLGVATYGGYFGAGIGILMLTILGALGLRNIHAMNGLKNFFGIAINGVAAAIFVASGTVVWSSAAGLLVGAVAGGYLGARLARRIGQAAARKAVVAVGLLVTVILIAHQI
jgi:uncharacterized protein